MSSNDDSLRIPIEIKTDELDEIRELINSISKAEGDLREIKTLPQRGKGGGDTASRSAFTRPNEVGRGGIFNEGFEGGRVPSRATDRTSAAPVQRANEFSKVKQDVAKLQTAQINVMQRIQGGLASGTQGIDLISTLGRKENILGKAGAEIGRKAGQFVVPIAVITTIVGLVNKGIELLLSPGGPWDRRFKRKINNEISSATERADKAKIAQGLKLIRMTSYSGFRGEGYSGNAAAIRAGDPIYNLNMEGRAKGIF